jgi:6-phosphogluconolactonase
VRPKLEIVEDPAAACAEMLLDAVVAGGHVMLTGGSTPKAAYEQLAGELNAGGVDVGRTTFWFGDERCVPPDDERSNFRMVQQALLQSLTGPVEPEVHRMRGELGPEQGAQDYERQLGEAGLPEFDLLLLGLGPDGHTASLFPDQDTLRERSRLVVGVPEAGLDPFVPRISLTLTALAAAKRVLFLVSGVAKADAVAAAFGPGAEPTPRVPASLLPPLARGEVTVFLDLDAAARLTPAEGAD